METPTVRGCGTRKKGGIYAETRMSEHGAPVEFFLIDHPKPSDAIKAIGIQVITIGDVNHVLDWIGEAHYPYPADFIEETRRMGLSRRLPTTFDFSQLCSESKVICAHRHACTHRPCMGSILMRDDHCGRRIAGRDLVHKADEPCSADHWQVAHPTRTTRHKTGRINHRAFNGFTYEVEPFNCPFDTAPGLFLAMPITHIVGIRSDIPTDEATFQRVQGQVSLPFEIVDE